MGTMARHRTTQKRIKRITAPATADELKDYVEACAKVELEAADNLRKLAAAFVKYVNEHGKVTYPLKFAPPDEKR